MGHLEVGFAFEPDATLEKPELHGIVDFRLGIEVGDRTVLKQALRTPPPVDDEFAVLRIRKDAPYLTVETQGDAQHQRDGNHDGGDAKKNAAAPAAREGGFDPREDALRGDLLPLVVAAGLLPVEVAAHAWPESVASHSATEAASAAVARFSSVLCKSSSEGLFIKIKFAG